MANEQMREFWTTGAAGWVANERIFDSVLAPFATAILGAADLTEGERLLDVGCGTGVLVELAAPVVGAAVGIDISPPMIAAATERVPSASFAVLDAQTGDVAAAGGGPYDVVVSRFGVMFFDDPAAAFANIRAGCRPGARMVFACWRSVVENPMFSLGTSVLVDRLDPKPPTPPPGTPGPTAFEDSERLTGILADAGWSDVVIEPLDVTLDYGIDGSDGVEERLMFVLGAGAGRIAREQLEPQLGPDGWAALVDEVRAEIRASRVDGLVRFPGATWLVTAKT